MPAALIFNSKECQHKLVDFPFAFLLSEKPLAHVETLVFVSGSDRLHFLLLFLPNGFLAFDPDAAQKLYQHLGAELLRMRDEEVYDFFLIVSQREDPFQHAEHGAGPLCRIGKCTFLVSRKHPNLVRCLFEQEVAEVADGTVQIMAIAREAGSRSKMAVLSNSENVDPVGACVGQNGSRVAMVVDELNGEKIDIVNWDENPAYFIENALSPAKVVTVLVDEEDKQAKVVVPDYQLSLAIGREGQNARLTARLTGFKIDIKSETQAIESGELDEFQEEYYNDGYDENAEQYPDEYYDDGQYSDEGVYYDDGSYEDEGVYYDDGSYEDANQPE